MMTFDRVSDYLQKHLRTGTTLKNWTAFKGYLGDTMTVVGMRENYIEIDAPNAICVQSVPKKDFESVWEVWVDYKRQKVKRQELTPMTRFSKYVISILHWYDDA